LKDYRIGIQERKEKEREREMRTRMERKGPNWSGGLTTKTRMQDLQGLIKLLLMSPNDVTEGS